MSPRRLRAATRASPLARWQTDHVVDLLSVAHPGLTVEPVAMTAAPDRDLSKPIADIGGKGAFAKEVQAAVLDGRADIAVHSAKDLPSETVPGMRLAAVLERGDPRDVLVGTALDDLRAGATVATGSARRRVQLAHARPDLRFVGLRGNIQRRVAQVGTSAGDSAIDAIVAAGVALLRQDMAAAVADWLDPDVVLPQVGQGAIAVECRADDDETAELLAAVEHAESRRRVDAERSFLVALGGDCDLPAGAFATLEGDEIVLRGMVASADETRLERRVVRGPDPFSLGPALLGEFPADLDPR